jgi:long-subunit fatty acid transport protein
MRRIMAGLATAAILLASATGAGAQSRFSVELRGGAALPTESFGDVDLETGFGFEFTARYRLMQHLSAYAGWDWYHFSTDAAADGDELDVEDTGYAFGFIFEHPLTTSLDGWLRAGGIYDHAEVEQGSDITLDTGHGLGFSVGAGVALPIGDRLRLTPGARYRSFSRDIEVAGLTSEAALRYIALELGASFRF